MGIIWTILIGLIAGLVARAIKPGNDAMGWIMTAVLGVAGSFFAQFIGAQLGWYQEGESAGFIASVLGAIALLFIWGLVTKNKK
ncbi:GlsB/YeaQ/YmgE family stress response membrane protein [Corticibacter populi]|uniref:GlsB/YeaQ/YmgE family stress response membrane protein n=1 Tax=Corticibacter populi TaxID=1550736 RepID=A0A3M6R088_9BURK|nr:GlsB/YeaQ/YmgE family stress response membrane protein [Corticibacter populi]RMX08593.1 GlsB/YeaQ/YmgE family stress response membrane protein [Corticibacter populi]RZS35917.1 putative membrane protein YeaQ/YmgE (transglycosylase-associated protein family) [Corticibacter populi]